MNVTDRTKPINRTNHVVGKDNGMNEPESALQVKPINRTNDVVGKDNGMNEPESALQPTSPAYFRFLEVLGGTVRLSQLRLVSGVNHVASPPGRRENISRPTSFSSNLHAAHGHWCTFTDLYHAIPHHAHQRRPCTLARNVV